MGHHDTPINTVRVTSLPIGSVSLFSESITQDLRTETSTLRVSNIKPQSCLKHYYLFTNLFITFYRVFPSLFYSLLPFFLVSFRRSVSPSISPFQSQNECCLLYYFYLFLHINSRYPYRLHHIKNTHLYITFTHTFILSTVFTLQKFVFLLFDNLRYYIHVQYIK